MSMLIAALKQSVNTAALLRPVTGNGSKPVNGRGIKHRKLSPQQRISLAADLATAVQPYVPSLADACSIVGASIPSVRNEIKKRVAAANGNGHVSVPVVEDANTEETSAATVDTPAVAVTPAIEETDPFVDRPDRLWWLTTGLLSASPEQRVQIARELGVDWIWDSMIMPCIRCDGND
jgi:hypothetical protein